jgi:hypothetical protein
MPDPNGWIRIIPYGHDPDPRLFVSSPIFPKNGIHFIGSRSRKRLSERRNSGVCHRGDDSANIGHPRSAKLPCTE